MGKGTKRTQKKTQKQIDVASLRQRVQRGDITTTAETAEVVAGDNASAIERAAAAGTTSDGESPVLGGSSVSEKLFAFADAGLREEGCNDVAAMAFDAQQLQVIVGQQLHRKLLEMACADSVLAVRVAAAAALRNVLSAGGDLATDSLFPSTPATSAEVGADTALAAEVMTQLTCCVANPSAFEDFFRDAAGRPLIGDDDESGASWISPRVALLKELLELSSLAADSSETVAQALMPAVPVLLQLILRGGAQSEATLRLAAADLFAILSDDSAPVSQFLGSQLDPATSASLLALLQQIPVSPALVRLSMTMAVALLGALPTAANLTIVLPLIAHVMQEMPPLLAAAQAASLLAASSSASWSNEAVPSPAGGGAMMSPTGAAIVDPGVRQHGFVQCLDRLRAFNRAASALHLVLDVITDNSNPRLAEEDEERAFLANPLSALLLQPLPGSSTGATPLASTLALRTAELMSPVQDATLRAALQADPSALTGDLAALVNAVSTAQVAVFSVVAALLMLVPPAALGDTAGMWQMVMQCFSDRLDAAQGVRSTAAAVANDNNNAASNDQQASSGVLTASYTHQTAMQLDSLAQMAWTLLRKDDGISPLPQHVDLLTRCFWLPDAVSSCREAIVGAMGHVASRQNVLPSSHTACANFLLRALQRGAASSSSLASSMSKTISADNVDLRAETANSLIDAFSDERFDELYIALKAHEVLTAFLYQLRLVCRSLPRGHRGSAEAEQRRHLEEIATNLSEFLKYKAANVRGLPK